MRADTHIRVQTLQGMIKQADSDIAETALQLERAKANVALCERNHDAAKDRATALRQEREQLADETAAAIRRAGEMEFGADTHVAGEEVIQSPRGDGAWPSAYGEMQQALPQDQQDTLNHINGLLHDGEPETAVVAG